MAATFRPTSSLFMPASQPPGFFLTGSDTDVGKTWIGCLLLKSLRQRFARVGAYKPVASGVDRLEESDPFRLWQASDQSGSLSMVCPQTFRAPLAPQFAAELEGRTVDVDRVRSGYRDWFEHVDCLVVEGAGGLLSPLAPNFSNADLASELGLPLIIVVANRVGAVNQSLLTLEAAYSRDLDVAALVLNRVDDQPAHPSQARHPDLIRASLQAGQHPIPEIIETTSMQSTWHDISLPTRLCQKTRHSRNLVG